MHKKIDIFWVAFEMRTRWAGPKIKKIKNNGTTTLRWNRNCRCRCFCFCFCRCQDSCHGYKWRENQGYSVLRTQNGNIIYKWSCSYAVRANEVQFFRRYYIKIYIASCLCCHFWTRPLLFCWWLACLSGFRVSCTLCCVYVCTKCLLEMSYGVGLPLFTTFIDNHATVQCTVWNKL